MMHIAVLVLLGATTTMATASPRWVDKPAWPKKAETVEIAWLVHPVPEDATTPETTLAPVDVEITVGSVTRKIKLAPRFGGLYPYNQAVCKTTSYPLLKSEVAKITFYEGGAGGYFVRRARDVLAIIYWNESEVCNDKHGNLIECPRSERVVFQLHVPAHAKIRESLVEVDNAGARHPLACQ